MWYIIVCCGILQHVLVSYCGLLCYLILHQDMLWYVIVNYAKYFRMRVSQKEGCMFVGRHDTDYYDLSLLIREPPSNGNCLLRSLSHCFETWRVRVRLQLSISLFQIGFVASSVVFNALAPLELDIALPWNFLANSSCHSSHVWVGGASDLESHGYDNCHARDFSSNSRGFNP